MSRLLYSKQKEQRVRPLLFSHFTRIQRLDDGYFFFLEELLPSLSSFDNIYNIITKTIRYSKEYLLSSSLFPPNWKLILDSVSPLKFIPTGGTSILYQNHTLITILFVNFIFYIQYINFRQIKHVF